MSKSKNRWIIGLLLVGVVSFAIMQLVVIPRRNRTEEQYAQEQLNPLTQDFNAIAPYENAYLGDNSNTMNLFRSLPMAQEGMTFQLYSEELKIEVRYPSSLNEAAINTMPQNEEAETDQSNHPDRIVNRALLYNVTAVFALIKNTEELSLIFDDQSVTFYRDEVTNIYPDWDQLLNEEQWTLQVQEKLKEDSYVDKTLESILHD